jgi:predicted  nucleic acid-binding Zn-ribbon protein
MIRRLIDGAVRSSFEELLRQPLSEIRQDIAGIRQDMVGIKQTIVGIQRDIVGIQQDIVVIKQDIVVIKQDIVGMRGEIGDLKDGQNRLDFRLDDTNKQIMALGARLDARIDEVAVRQGRMVEEVAGLKRDQHSADVLERRVARIEDRLFARAS